MCDGAREANQLPGEPVAESYDRIVHPLRWLTAMSLVLLTVAGCSDTSDSDTDFAGAYARVIQWFVDRTGPPTSEGDREPMDVFVEARGEGVNIGLSMQAAIIARADPFATVRFIDDRDEALTEEGTKVRDDGVLLALGGAKETGSHVVIECDEFVAADQERTWRFELQTAHDEWMLRGEPEQVES